MAKITLRPTSGTGDSWTNVANVYDGNESTLSSVSTSIWTYEASTLVLDFDTSVIPSEATINSATLTIRSKAGKNTVKAYVDINQNSANRVINQQQTTSVTNYTADVTNYMSDLTSVEVTAANSNWSRNTFELYELWIDVDYDYTASTTYTVTFKDYDGSIIDTQTVPSGGSATPPTPIRTGYDFTGWSGGSYTNVTSNVVLTAQYSIKTFTVRFLDWDNSVISTQTVTRGGSATPPSNPTRVGYNFTGWDKSFTNITANTDIHAQYTIKTYTVRFLDWNGTVLDIQTINHGSNATPPPNPTRDGYTFSGWSGSYTNITSDVDIVAQYTQNSSGGDDTSVKNIKIGNSTISKLYLGTSQIVKVYLGDTLIYGGSSSGGEDDDIDPNIDPTYNYFVFDTSLADTTINLYDYRAGDTTDWDGITDWGDGTTDTELKHTYATDGTYTVKTKYMLNGNRTNAGFLNTRNMLIGCDNINKNITTFSYLFYNSPNLSYAKIRNFNDGTITAAINTFNGCSSLTELDLSKLNTDNITSMYQMLYNCSSLALLNISGWNTSNVTNSEKMLAGCPNLTIDNITMTNCDDATKAMITNALSS